MNSPQIPPELLKMLAQKMGMAGGAMGGRWGWSGATSGDASSRRCSWCAEASGSVIGCACV